MNRSKGKVLQLKEEVLLVNFRLLILNFHANDVAAAGLRKNAEAGPR